MREVHSQSPAPGPPPVALTIAGSDPSGGAGIQADLKTFAAFDVYGAAVLTSITVQNTVAVRDRTDLDAALVIAQLAAVQDDLPVAAAKTGLLGTRAQVETLATHLRARPVPALVVDPVLVATAGQALTDGATLASLRARLLPLATLVTPNLSEASALLDRSVHDLATMRDAARALVDLGAAAALVKGGHLPGSARDILFVAGALHELDAERVDVGRTHGAGCTLAAAVTAKLASGAALTDAVAAAKRYVTRALVAAPALGHGARPLDHRVSPVADDSNARTG